MSDDDGFVSRWSQRKAQVRAGLLPTEPVQVTQPPAGPPAVESGSTRPPSAQPVALPPTPPLPTLDDVAKLTRDSDFSRFVLPGVDESVKRAAMKKLFSDPHFNVMDGLDTYIDDYGLPDPIPDVMLRRMTQSKFLRLFDDDVLPAEAPVASSPPKASPDGEVAAALPQSDAGTPAAHAPETLIDEDPALRLQPDDAIEPAGAGPDRPGARP